MTMTVDDIKHSIADLGGFICKFTDGVTEYGECSINARIFRWSLIADESDRARVKESLRNVLTDFAEFRNPNLGYVHFAKHLGLDMF